ncbi:hypothetical protein CBR_g30059 [Chara braunii]|uniref:Myb-like domain-containing protein n=1 Tax=Chara braunii TaxID=69332 RepID=A0A388LBU2_CHABU|nr:hypothetical protein CBR_g30059 [Chara braunii]|eukprot:GBG79797.1 hypothetical protein CBR_g30059 [Chara braunii]
MRTTSDGDGGAEGGVDDDMCEDVDEVEEEEEEEEEMEDEVPPPSSGHKKTPAKKGIWKGRGKGKAGSGGRTIWNLDDSLTLVRCKRDQDEALAAAGHNFVRMKNKEWKWTDVANRMGALGVKRDWDQCMKRWENIFSWYKKVQLREKESVKQSFFTLTPKQRNEEGYKFQTDRRLFEAIDAGQHGNQTIHPPNLVDTGVSQLQGGGNGGGGETSASENGEASGGQGSGSRSSGGFKFSKKKNARQQAFEAVTDVMSAHSTVVVDSVDRASKRQCDVFQRQCDIMEMEVKVQETQCEVLDAGTVMFYEFKQRRGEGDGRHVEVGDVVTREDWPHYEVDVDGRTCLMLAVHLGFARRLLRNVVIFVTKISSAVPNRWTRGVDVTGDMVRMLVSVLAKEFEERLHHPSTFQVVVDAPLEPKDDLHGDVHILRDDIF